MEGNWRRHLARSLSTVENRAPGWRDILAPCFTAREASFVMGVTGPPGSGKSTLIDAIASIWAGQGHRVGIIAVDPASPFSGGAVLGDRVRMRRAEDMEGVFIRSMSARGYAGGLNESALDLCAVMARAGVSRILLETVGTGQNEVDIAFVADCTLVVAVPGLGDSVQAAKAGLMEVGDLYVVNKADLPGAAMAARDIANMLALVFPGRPGSNTGDTDRSMVSTVPGPARDMIEARYGRSADPAGSWHPPVLTVVATESDSLNALIAAIEAYAAWQRLSPCGAAKRRLRVNKLLRDILRRRLFDDYFNGQDAVSHQALAPWIERIIAGEVDPYSAVDTLVGSNPASHRRPA
jgi:LAO/AO transport system kinase